MAKLTYTPLELVYLAFGAQVTDFTVDTVVRFTHLILLFLDF